MKIAEQKIISCILPKGKALPLIEKLSNDYGLTALDFNFARGKGRITPQKHRLIESSEKELLTVMVSAEQADDCFETIYYLAEINRPHGGLMYMYSPTQATTFTLPDLPEEE